MPLLRSWENFFGRGLQIFRAYGVAGRRREIEMRSRAGNMTIKLTDPFSATVVAGLSSSLGAGGRGVPVCDGDLSGFEKKTSGVTWEKVLPAMQPWLIRLTGCRP
jgi:hypothetical protein